MIAKEEFPELRYMLTCYYFQTWQEAWGPEPEDPIELGLLTLEQPAKIRAVYDDLIAFLAASLSDDDIEQFAHECELAPTPDGFRGFLAHVREVFDAYWERSRG